MANPVVTAIPINVWTKVLTNVTSGQILPLKVNVTNTRYVWTYRETGGAAPANGTTTEGKDIADEGISLSASTGIDVYVAVNGNSAGSVRIDTIGSAVGGGGGAGTAKNERVESRTPFTGTAVDVDIDPGCAFKLIDVALTLSAGPTTSGVLTIKTLNGDGDAFTEWSEDLSIPSPTNYIKRFEKPFTNGRTIAIDYANADALNIVVAVQYEKELSVAG